MHDHSWSLFILPVHSWFIKLKNETTGPHLFLNGKLFAAKRCIHGNISTYHVADIPGHRPKSDLAEVSIMRQCWGSHATWHQTAQRHHKTGSTSRSKLGNQQRMKRRLRCAVSFYMQQMLHSYPWFIFFNITNGPFQCTHHGISSNLIAYPKCHMQGISFTVYTCISHKSKHSIRGASGYWSIDSKWQLENAAFQTTKL